MTLLLSLLLSTHQGDTPPAAPARRNVASVTRAFTGSTVADIETSMATYTIHADLDEFTLLYTANQFTDPLPNDVTFEASVDGHPVTWGGEPSGLCPAGGVLESDPIRMPVTAGGSITVTTTAIAPGGVVPTVSAGDVGPAMVRAETNAPSVIVLGSSSGQSPHFTDGFEAAGIATLNASRGGRYAQSFQDQTLHAMGVTGRHGLTHAFLQVGINSNGKGVGEMCQGAVDLAWRCKRRGIPHVTQVVWKPHTQSADGWTTVEGQTPAHTDRAVAVDWLRRGAPVTRDGLQYDLQGGTPGALYVGDPGHPFDDICDWSAAVQDAGNPNAFRVDHGPITGDGLHLTTEGYALGEPALKEWAERVKDAWGSSRAP